MPDISHVMYVAYVHISQDHFKWNGLIFFYHKHLVSRNTFFFSLFILLYNVIC